VTAADAVGPAREQGGRRLPLAITLALRELRSGLSGFGIFIACIALGVAVIAGVGAASDGLRAGFERQGEAILGGDLTVSRMHVRAFSAERPLFDGLGRVSESATMRTMARRADGSDQALAELKFVDDDYPLVGEVKLDGGMALQEALKNGAAVEPVLLERLGLKVGDSVMLGNAEVKIAATIKSEPDGISDRLTYGPRIFAPQSLIEKSGLVKPGTLIRWRYALKLNPGREASADEIEAARRHIKSELPEAGFTIVDRRDPSPQISRSTGCASS
jgi:putative ABC transport system permease protein